MDFDNIPLDRMRPDGSAYEKGLRLMVNATPHDAGSWKELRAAQVAATTALPASSIVVGKFSDPRGIVYYGTSDEANSRLYEVTQAIVGLPPVIANRTPGSDYAGSARFWRFTKFGDTVIAVGTLAPIQLQARTGGVGNFANLVTSADRPQPRYLCTSQSYVLAAFNEAGGAGIYNTFNPYQFMWSSRNNAAIWTPGADRAGFSPTNDALGYPTGLAGFKEFAILFQQEAVTRLSWVGGDAVWQSDEIAFGEWGLGIAEFNGQSSGGIVRAGRDVYYFANRGPAVVRNGESVEALGDGELRAFLMDQIAGTTAATDFTLALGSDISAEYDPISGCIIWSLEQLQTHLVFQLVYHIASGRFSVLDGQPGARYLGVNKVLGTSRKFDNLRLIDSASGSVSIFNGAATQAIRAYTQRWRPATGRRVSLHGVRPLLLLNLRGGTYPPVALSIEPIEDPIVGPGNAQSVSSASRDPNGWWTSSVFPMEANEFLFTLTIPDLGTNPTIDELPAIELAYTEASVF